MSITAIVTIASIAVPAFLAFAKVVKSNREGGRRPLRDWIRQRRNPNKTDYDL